MSCCNRIQKISTALGGITPSGYSQVTRNQSYYACTSKWSILFFKIPDFKHRETLCQGSAQIKMIRLSSASETLIAILYSNNIIQLYDFVERTIIDQQTVEDSDISWMDFNFSSTLLLLFSKTLGNIFIYNIAQKSLKKTFIFSLLAIKFFIVNPEMENIAICVGANNSIVRLDYSEPSIQISDQQSHVSCLKFDPLNCLNCLLVESSPTWKVFTFLPKFNIIAKSKRDDLNCTSGDWVSLMPGHIITGDRKSGIIYLWSVGTGEIVESVTLYDFGILSIVSISDKDYALVFEDGAIGLFDFTRKTLSKMVTCAHTNTVFQCLFLPTESSILATASADGNIVLWNSPSLSVRDRFKPSTSQKLQFLCASFSPGGGFIACGSTKGVLYIYSLKERRLIHKAKIHDGLIIGVSWCPHNNDIIATSGEDKTCHFFSLQSLKTKTTISTKSALKRIQWSNNTETIAIACSDGSLYVRREGGAYQIIKGNEGSPLFEVDWHPKDDNLVAASDDDGNIIVFHLDKATSFLAPGHKGQARPVCWSQSIDYLLFSGGYDGVLILWDSRNMSKIASIQAHSTHIYGICTHKDHPMLIATVSRDETVRLWAIDKIFPKDKIEAVLSDEKFAISKYCYYEGCDILLKLLHRVLRDGTKVSFFENELCHANDVVRVTRKRINKLTAAAPKDQDILLRAKNAQKKISEAAELSLKSGDIKRACELLFLIGEYNKAISFAPAVSFKFWQNLVMMRGQMLKGTDGEAIHSIIAGKPELATEQLVALNNFANAELVCASMRESSFCPRTKTERADRRKHKELNQPKSPENSQKSSENLQNAGDVSEPQFLRMDFDEADDFSCYQVSSNKSLTFAREGKPMFAAAALLTVGDVIGASWRLFHSGEICWAMEIVKCIDDDNFQASIREEFVKYCIFHQIYEDAFDLLSQGAKRRLVSLIDFKSDSEKDKFYSKHKLRSMDQYSLEAIRMKGSQKVQCLMLAGKQKEAETLAISLIRSMMAVQMYDFSEAKILISIVSNAQKVSDEVAALSHFFGVYEAMWKGYDVIVEKLISAIGQLNISWINNKLEELNVAAALALAKNSKESANKYISSLEGMKKEAFEGIAQLDDQAMDGGCTVKSHGSGIIPTDMGSTMKFSLFTGKRIDGNFFVFEDGKSAVSEDEAIMWYEVSPFSPLETHERFMPF